jgi:hypothetical protein
MHISVDRGNGLNFVFLDEYACIFKKIRCWLYCFFSGSAVWYEGALCIRFAGGQLKNLDPRSGANFTRQ